MNLCQFYTRLGHALTAKHWRGAAIHSPMMFRFVREVVMRHSRRELCDAIRREFGPERVRLIHRAEELERLGPCAVAVFPEPFRSRAEKRRFRQWYDAHHCVVAHLQGTIVIFFDPKLQKQYYRIRN